MVVKVGVIGTGAMGRAHIDRLTNVLTGAEVVAVTDIDHEAAEAAVRDFHLNAKVYPDDTSLLQDPDIDAVFVVSFGGAHEATVLKALDTDKFIFTEKPLATTLEGAKRIVDKELTKSKKVIQVGFMRRYDQGIRALKEKLDTGIIGAPLVVRASHINPNVASNYSNEMAITDTLIHEIDEMHWLLDDEYTSIQITYPRQSAEVRNEGLHDPQLATLTTKKGQLFRCWFM
ncbi:myo-inositol 2-dehydrogenase [Lacticaseibacillus paracasei]|nr:myo-inositol 2-dehydrogenase [Lacticaseibacillus paracasei]EKQ04659.1 myo-inositol 2-dehydrogenase [Lacticaseibacillus casei 21/1]EKQ06473.1 myo-inositol 2-dehydrogenase [Lacticaseibacillus paracasei]EKQ16461.1 myo-inositol 2-dehydrogenase [Lacticaseibacillus paracasei]EKQ25222.1 myo-inositol 2-dehydrogenase [Lacticaseibacillus paracasei]